MTSKICQCCGQSFEPRPQVPNQTFCSSPNCQRVRRQRWQRDKMRNDPDYRDNQHRNQRAWLDRHPEYWRNYRATHPDYTEHNKSHQRLKHHARHEPDYAKMDVSLAATLEPGLYLIERIQGVPLTKSDSWIIQITPICMDCPCKKDACKDRT
jgi:hypothetical protein